MGDGADRRRRRLRRLTETNNGKSRFFRVQARLFGRRPGGRGLGTLADLGRARPGSTGTGARSGSQALQRAGPAVSVGTRVFKRRVNVARPRQSDLPPPGADLVRAACGHRPSRRRGSVVRREPRDQGHLPGPNPFLSTSNSDYDTIHLHQGQPDDDWYPDVVLRFFMLLWQRTTPTASARCQAVPAPTSLRASPLFVSTCVAARAVGGCGSSDPSTAERSPPSSPSACSTRSRTLSPGVQKRSATCSLR